MSHFLRVKDLDIQGPCRKIDHIKFINNKILLSNQKAIWRHFYIADNVLYNYHITLGIYFMWPEYHEKTTV